MNELSVKEAKKAIDVYCEDWKKDPNGRYMSWRHCYNAFKNNKNTDNPMIIDYLALHLGFYLASWGMFRSSGFIFYKDYKVHTPVVELIIDKKYEALWGIEAKKLIDENNMQLLADVSKKIQECYKRTVPENGKTENVPSDTLVTKILLGTYGCVPAYDEFVCNATKKYGLSNGKYNEDSIKKVAKYYKNHDCEFEKIRDEIQKSAGMEYPQMKIMDMCLWQLGKNMQEDKAKESKKGE